MGSKKKASAKKNAEVSVAAVVPKPQGTTAKASKVDEIEEIFEKKRKISSENQPTLAEDDAIGSRSSSQKKKKVKKTTSPADEQDGRRKAELKISSSGKSSSAGAAQKKSRKKTADGLTIYGEDELKWNSKDAGGTSLCPFDCKCCF